MPRQRGQTNAVQLPDRTEEEGLLLLPGSGLPRLWVLQDRREHVRHEGVPGQGTGHGNCLW